MAVTAHQFAKLLLSMANKEVDLDSDDIRLRLFTNLLTPDYDDNQYFDAAPYTSNEVSGGGYPAGGIVLSNEALSYSNVDATINGGTVQGVVTFDADDPTVTVTGDGFVYRHGIFMNNTPASNKPLVVGIDFGADVVAIAGTHTIQLDALGISRWGTA